MTSTGAQICVCALFFLYVSRRVSSMRIAIVGNSGSGKSTLARQLGEVHALPVLDLDTVAWEQGRIAVPRSVTDAAADLRAFCDAHDGWVIEGCYGNLTRVALERSPVLLFLEPGVDACRANNRNRPWEPHKYASKEEQDERLELLLAWVEEYYTRTDSLSLADHHALFDGYTGNKLLLTQPPDRGFVEVQPLRWFGDDAVSLRAITRVSRRGRIFLWLAVAFHWSGTRRKAKSTTSQSSQGARTSSEASNVASAGGTWREPMEKRARPEAFCRMPKPAQSSRSRTRHWC